VYCIPHDVNLLFNKTWNSLVNEFCCFLGWVVSCCSFCCSSGCASTQIVTSICLAYQLDILNMLNKFIYFFGSMSVADDDAAVLSGDDNLTL
jgi:hypothetical protein